MVGSSLKSNELWHLQNKDKIETTARLFRTAYSCCLRYEPFTTYSEILKLQKLNGLDVGRNLYSDHACHDVLEFIADQMRQVLLNFIVKSDRPFSLMFDESTSVSTVTCLILYIRIEYDNVICNLFLDLINLNSQQGQDIANAVCMTLERCGFTEEALRRRLIGICTDGASNLQGEMNGGLALMKSMLETDFVTFHCMAHKLELAVNDVIKSVSQLGHFQAFTDSLYSHFSRSPKNQAQLKSTAAELHLQLLKSVRTFDIRWVSSSYRSVHAIWQAYEAISPAL